MNLEQRIRRIEEKISSNKIIKENSEEYTKADIEFLDVIDSEFRKINQEIYAFQVLLQDMPYIPKEMRQKLYKASVVFKQSQVDFKTIRRNVEDSYNTPSPYDDEF